MNPRLEIQGRLIARRDGVIVRDEVRHATALDLVEAQRVARDLVTEGFTVWVFAVEVGPGPACRYRQAACQSPDDALPLDRDGVTGSVDPCAA